MVNKSEKVAYVLDAGSEAPADKPKPEPAPVSSPEPREVILEDFSRSGVLDAPAKMEWDFGDGAKDRKSKRLESSGFLYTAPDGGSITTTYSTSYTTSPDDHYSGEIETGSRDWEKTGPYEENLGDAGILTAGELHDFSKWNLWTDIATDALAQYQTAWDIRPMERFSTQVSTDKGRPIVDAEVELVTSYDKVVWTGRTDNTGKAELWADMYLDKQHEVQPQYTIRVKYQGRTNSKPAGSFGDNGVNHISFSTQCDISNAVDAMFVVDATGSMSDEINYLKAELNSIIGKFKEQNKDLSLRVGSVFYRDHGDAYVTRESALSENPSKAVEFIQEQSADGGGDFPEAVEAALEKAMSMNWSSSARTRLLFLVLDAPPHQTPDVKKNLWKSIDLAAKKGIRIIPITASGIDKATEYLMRSMALATNGTYVFLTDHSGVGNPHIEPTTDSYDVEKLNDLLLRLFTQFTYAPDCKEQSTSELPGDTLRILNPMTDVQMDTTAIASNDSAATILIGPVDSTLAIPDPFDIPKPEALVCYPNPTRGLLNVEVVGDMKELYLADMSGKLLERYTVDGHVKGKQRLMKVSLDNYPAGMYFLKCEVNGHWLSGKVILVR